MNLTIKITRDYLNTMVSKLETCIVECNKAVNELSTKSRYDRVFAEQVFDLVHIGKEDLIDVIEGLGNNISKESLTQSVNVIKDNYSQKITQRVCKLLDINETIETEEEDEKWL